MFWKIREDESFSLLSNGIGIGRNFREAQLRERLINFPFEKRDDPLTGGQIFMVMQGKG